MPEIKYCICCGTEISRANPYHLDLEARINHKRVTLHTEILVDGCPRPTCLCCIIEAVEKGTVRE